jgi:hypothetical protein
LALLLIWCHAPSLGIAAALIAGAVGAVGIHRTAERIAMHDRRPADVRTPSEAAALYFACDHEAGRMWKRIAAAPDRAERTAQLRALAGLVEDMAVVYCLVEDDARVAAEVQRDMNDEVRLLNAVAAAEASIVVTRRKRPWSELEQHAGDLLDALADPSVDGTARAELYSHLAQRVIDAKVVAGQGSEVLDSISRCLAPRTRVNTR